MNTTSYHWQEVLASKELTPEQREAAEKVYTWQAQRDAISRGVADGTIASLADQDRQLAAIGAMPAVMKIGGSPVRERFYINKMCFTFDHNVSTGFGFSVE